MILKKIVRKIYQFKSNFYATDIFPGGFDEHKCIFIHVPKSAGSSICMSLFGHQVGHAKYENYLLSNPKKTEGYFKFTFVRNPWDRLLSAYTFLKRGGMHTSDAKWAEENLSGYNDFNDFVLDWVNEKNIYKFIHFIPQHVFLQDLYTGVIRMNYVGQVETLQQDMEFIANKLKIKGVQISQINSTKHNSYKEVYNEKSRKIVEEVYAKDIILFNYKY